MRLDEIKKGDIFGQPPDNWWERWACRVQGARFFHFGWFVNPIVEDGQIVDWATSEAISTGVDMTRLDGRRVGVMRIIVLPEPSLSELVTIHSDYGDLPYNWEVNFLTAIWYVAKHYLGKTIRVIKTHGLNCIGWVVCYGVERKVQLIPPNQYVTEAALESSPLIEYIGEVNLDTQSS